jgi:hypothetical protein
VQSLPVAGCGPTSICGATILAPNLRLTLDEREHARVSAASRIAVATLRRPECCAGSLRVIWRSNQTNCASVTRSKGEVHRLQRLAFRRADRARGRPTPKVGVDVKKISLGNEADKVAKQFFSPHEVRMIRSLPRDQRVRGSM